MAALKDLFDQQQQGGTGIPGGGNAPEITPEVPANTPNVPPQVRIDPSTLRQGSVQAGSGSAKPVIDQAARMREAWASGNQLRSELRLGQEWYQDANIRSYWENPSNIARYKFYLDGLPTGSQTPEWLNAGAVNFAYDELARRNQGKPWYEWARDSFAADDPIAQTLRLLPAPPTEFQQDYEMNWAGDAGETWRRYLTEMGYQPRAENLPSTSSGSVIGEGAVEDPYGGMYAQVGNFRDLPVWQQAYLSLFSPQPGLEDRPEWTRATAALVQGLMAGTIGGVAGGAIGGPPGAVIGFLAVTGASAYQAYTGKYIPVLSETLEVFDAGERLAKLGIGLGSQVIEDGLDEVLADLPAAALASSQVYNSFGFDVLNAVSKPGTYIEELIKGLGSGLTLEEASRKAGVLANAAIADVGEVWKISEGYTEPVPILGTDGQPIDGEEWKDYLGGQALGQVRDSLQGEVKWGDILPWLASNQTPETVAMTLADWEWRYGDTGQFTDLVGSTAIDAGNAIGRVELDMGRAVSLLAGDKRLAAAFQQSKGNWAVDLAPFGIKQVLTAAGMRESQGLVQTMQQYADWVRTGYYPAGSLPAGSVVTPQAAELGWFEKWVGGLDADGNVKELRAGEGQQGWLRSWRELTPDSKAGMALENFADSVGTLVLESDNQNASRVERAKALVDTLEKLGGVNVFAVGSLGEQIINSPIFGTSAGAYQTALNNEAVSGYLTQYLADQGKIDLLEQAAKALGVHPSKLVEDLSKTNGRKKVFAALKETVSRKATSTGSVTGGDANAKVLMEAIADGSLNESSFLDELSVFTGINSKGQKTESHAWTFEDWRARVLNSVFDLAEQALVDHYGVKPNGAFVRFAQTLKSAQSMLLLDMNPAYLLNNVINNWVTMSVEGIYGVMTRGQMDTWLDRFGVAPLRVGDTGRNPQGVDPSTTDGRFNTIRKAMEADDGAARIKKMINNARNKFGLMSKLSGMMEQSEGRRAFVVGMRNSWDALWRPGVGYEKMPDGLRQRLNRVSPGLADYIDDVVRGSMSRAEVEQLLANGERILSVERALDSAAAALMPEHPEVARDVLTRTGMDDELRGLLADAKTEEDVRRAFRIVMRDVEEYVATEQARQMMTKAEETRQRVMNEGFGETVANLMTEIELMSNKVMMDSYLEREAVAMDDAPWDPQFQKDSRRFKVLNDQVNQMMAGLFTGWGVRDEYSGQFLTAMARWKQTWQDGYNGYDVLPDGSRATAADRVNPNVRTRHVDGKNDLLRRFWNTEYDSREARTAAWKQTQALIRGLMEEGWQAELRSRAEIADVWAAMWDDHASTGSATTGTGEAARKYWDALTAIRQEMHDAEVKHQARLDKAKDKAQRDELNQLFYEKVYRPLIDKMSRTAMEESRQFRRKRDTGRVKVQVERPSTNSAQTGAVTVEDVEIELSAEAIERARVRIEREAAAEYYGKLDRDQVLEGYKRAFGLNVQEMEAMRMLLDLRAEAWGRENARPAGEWYGETFADLLSPEGAGLNPAAIDTNDQARLNQADLATTAKGSTAFLADGRAIVRGMRAADVSTAAHESWHVFSRQLGEADLQTVAAWTGTDVETLRRGREAFENRLPDEPISAEMQAFIDAEEQSARGFERWLAEGAGDAFEGNSRIAAVFKKFAAWIMDIYQRIVGSPIDVDLNQGMRDLYAKVLGLNKVERKGTSYRSKFDTSTHSTGSVQAGSVTGDSVRYGRYSDLQEARLALERVNYEPRTESERFWRAGVDAVLAEMAKSFGKTAEQRVYLPHPMQVDPSTGSGSVFVPTETVATAVGLTNAGTHYVYRWEELGVTARLRLMKVLAEQKGMNVRNQVLAMWAQEGPAEVLRRMEEMERAAAKYTEAEAIPEPAPEPEGVASTGSATVSAFSQIDTDYDRAREAVGDDHPLRRWVTEKITEENTPAWLRDEVRRIAKAALVYGEGPDRGVVRDDGKIIGAWGQKSTRLPILEGVQANYEGEGNVTYPRMEKALQDIIDGVEKDNLTVRAVKLFIEDAMMGESDRSYGSNGAPVDIGGLNLRYLVNVGGKFMDIAMVQYYELVEPNVDMSYDDIFAGDDVALAAFLDALDVYPQPDILAEKIAYADIANDDMLPEVESVGMPENLPSTLRLGSPRQGSVQAAQADSGSVVEAAEASVEQGSVEDFTQRIDSIQSKIDAGKRGLSESAKAFAKWKTTIDNIRNGMIYRNGFRVEAVAEPFRHGDYLIEEVWYMPPTTELAQTQAMMGEEGELLSMVYVPKWKKDGSAWQEAVVTYHDPGTVPGVQRATVVGVHPVDPAQLAVLESDGTLRYVGRLNKGMELFQRPSTGSGTGRQESLFSQGEDLPLFSGTAQSVAGEVFAPADESAVQGTLFDMRPQMEGAKKANDTGTSTGSVTEGQNALFQDGRTAEELAADAEMFGGYEGELDEATLTARADAIRSVAYIEQGYLQTPGELFALRTSKKFKDQGYINFAGEKVENVHDMAVLAQAFRNPLYETFRYVFMKGNEVLGTLGISSRLPAKTSSFPTNRDGRVKFGYSDLEKRMNDMGADGYYLVHNHPSGSSKPSQPDIAGTIEMSQSLPGFRGHVVVDHEQYSVIRVNKDGTPLVQTFYEELIDKSYDLRNDYTINHPQLDRIYLDIARLAAEIQRGNNHMTVIGAQGHDVVAILDISKQELEGGQRALEIFRKFAKNTGAFSVYVFGDTYKIMDFGDWYKTVEMAIRKDYITDFIYYSSDKPGELISYKNSSQIRPKEDYELGRGDREDYYSNTRSMNQYKIIENTLPKPQTEGNWLFQIAEPVNSPAFKNWFGESKVVDEDGRPLVVYHGTGAEFEAFDTDMFGVSTDDGYYGQGFYFTPESEEAMEYGSEVYPVYLSIKKPLELSYNGDAGKSIGIKAVLKLEKYGIKTDGIINTSLPESYEITPGTKISFMVRQDENGRYSVYEIETQRDGTFEYDSELYADDPREAIALFNAQLPNNPAVPVTISGVIQKIGSGQFTEAAQALGFDGVIIRGGKRELLELVAFTPEQIKHVNNRGTWDANNPNMYYQAAPTVEGRGVIAGSEAAPVGEAMGEVYTQTVRPMLNGMERNLVEQMRNPVYDASTGSASVLGRLDGDTRAALDEYLGQVESARAGTKLAALRQGTALHDAALLNYNKRYGFDNALEIFFPYQFWYTRSVMEWARRMIDKPQWFAMYARLRRKQREQEEKGVPTRLQGKLRLLAPYLPDWAGNMGYYDPLKMLFPMEAIFGGPFEQARMEQSRQRQGTYEILREQLATGEITDAEYEAAVEQQAGYAWDAAWAMAGESAGLESMSNPMGMVQMMMGPALYLDMPAKILQGRQNELSVLPMTRTGQAIEQSLSGTKLQGIGNLIGGAMAWPERKLREKFDLSEFGEYGDYYIDRQLANMAAENPMMTDAILQAMVTRQGDVYQEAYGRVAQEMALRVPGSLQAEAIKNVQSPQDIPNVLGSLFAGLFPMTLVGEGELRQRELADEYSQAWERYNAGDKSAVNAFFEAHPEYQARLSAFDEPEERLRDLLVSEIWDLWMAQQGPNKNLIAEQLPGFQEGFLDKATRDYSAFSVEQLAGFAHQLGGTSTGSVTGGSEYAIYPTLTGTALPNVAMEGLYSDEMNQAVANYWAAKEEQWRGYSDLEQLYYATRGTSTGSVPELEAYLQPYWDWKERYMQEHPLVKQYQDEQKVARIYEEYPAGMAQEIESYLYDLETRWGGVDIDGLQDEYYRYPKGSQERKNILAAHPELKAYWDWKAQWRERSGGVNLYLDRYKFDTSTGSVQAGSGNVIPEEGRQYVTPEELAQIDQGVMMGLLAYFAGSGTSTGSVPVLGNGTRALLEQEWTRMGRPGETLERFIEMIRDTIW